MSNILRIAGKEMSAYFDQPTGYIFVAVFLSFAFFGCFWLDAFFARNIADVRPLFHWMPLFMVFLVSALTMRMWSEERRSGTLEILLSAPVPALHYVLGKFLAALGLVAIALALTLGLPMTVAQIGPLDWGPVAGGYVAALFLAAAYIAIGLFVSAKSDNQIVSLIVTALLCGLFYLVGADVLTALFGRDVAQILALLGSGSRFSSIERGVIDLRDLYYYLSIAGVFLSLNVLTLEHLRWAADGNQRRHRQWHLLFALVIANFLAGNLWLQQIPSVRADITEGHVFTISDATRHYLGELKEPLLIRGYFSNKTHPLLAPLIPQLEDLLREYAIAGNGKVRVEFIDPEQHPAAEKEANSRYGIHPVPFQTSSRYQASVVNSYFDVVVSYGDQFETLSFRDLIEIKAGGDGEPSVTLRNPEYDITRAIKKVLYGYQGGGSLFASLRQPVTFHAFISADQRLPEPLVRLSAEIKPVVEAMKNEAGGKFDDSVQDPDAGNGGLAKQLEDRYGFQPLTTGLADQRRFWFYMTLESGERVVQIPLPGSLDPDGLKRTIRAGLKQFARGYLRTVAVYAPPAVSGRFAGQGGDAFGTLEEKLSETASLRHTDLKDGHVPADADLLLLLAPREMDAKQLYAVDQFVMKGGTVVIASSPFDVSLSDSLSASKTESGLGDWLRHNGLSIDKTLVLDPQNSRLPLPVERDLGGFRVQEIRMLDYPYFVDLRGDGMPERNGPTAGLTQLTMAWPSPITVDAAANKDRHVVALLQSSPRSWTSDSLDVTPHELDGKPFLVPAGSKTARHLLAVAVEGRFSSYFADKPSPIAAQQTPPAVAGAGKPGDKTATKPVVTPKPVFAGKVDHSPAEARIILFASNSIFSDDALALMSAGQRTEVLGPVQLLQNTIDWSLEDRNLLSIRGRGNFSRILMPLSPEQQRIWEYLNYLVAAGGLSVIWLLRRLALKASRRRIRMALAGGRP